jgi:hypothetical protein
MNENKWKRKRLKIEIFLEIAEALNRGAAGPCDYWYKRLAERFIEKADRLTNHSSGSEKDRST